MPLQKKVICAECKAPMELLPSDTYFYDNGEPRKYWVCTKAPDCNGRHGAHPDGTPLGTPGDARTKSARRQAHSTFDHWWRTRRISRGMAYKKLEEVMGLGRGEAHIGNFNVEQCLKVYKHFLKICMTPVSVPEEDEDGDRENR